MEENVLKAILETARRKTSKKEEPQRAAATEDPETADEFVHCILCERWIGLESESRAHLESCRKRWLLAPPGLRPPGTWRAARSREIPAGLPGQGKRA
jgi:hypothetical protein